MRKIILFLAAIIIVSSFCSCNNYDVAVTFKEKTVENGFNNLLAGGDMAYCENTLYFQSVLVPKVATMNAYKFTDKGKTDMLNDNNIPFFYITDFYEYNNQIYSFLEGDEFLSLYDNEKSEFVKSDIDINHSNIYYLSNDLKITYKSGKKLNVNYKGKNYVVKLDLGISHFYPAGDTIYLQNNRGWLYCYNLKTPDMEPEFIDELAKDGDRNVFSVCGEYVYYDYEADDEKNPNGLYRFSLKDKSHTLVINKEISCVNSLDNKFYFVADGNLYLDNLNSEPKKLTDIRTRNIYIFDNKWIYLDDLDGNIYRIDYKHNIVEKIDIYSK